MVDAIRRRPSRCCISMATCAKATLATFVSFLGKATRHQKRSGVTVVQWGNMTAPTTSKSPYLEALLNPMSKGTWSTLDEGKTALSELASLAIVNHNHSLWWNYIYLHEKYVEQFSPAKNDILPGFPDMDTAVKTKAPSVYNWYYGHRQLDFTPWDAVELVDLSLSVRAGFVDKSQACTHLDELLRHWSPRDASPVDRRGAPLWLLSSAWQDTPSWVKLLNVLHETPGAPNVGVGQIDRKTLPAETIWQWQCLAQKDISFLPADQAMKSLDILRLGGVSERTRSQCEEHFLEYFPQYKAQAEIAFSLGAPLWIPQIDALEGIMDSDVFEAGPEALHVK